MANVLGVTAVSWALCWLQHNHHLFDPLKKWDRLTNRGRGSVLTRDTQLPPSLLLAMLVAPALFFKINVHWPPSILSLVGMVLPTFELSEIGLRLIQAQEIFLSNPAPRKWFFNFYLFSQLESPGQKHRHNLYCALSTVTRSGPFRLFTLPHWIPFMSCGEGQEQTHKIVKGCSRRGLVFCLPA